MNVKTTRIEFRTNVNDKNLIEKAAIFKGQTLSSYILNKYLRQFSIPNDNTI